MKLTANNIKFIDRYLENSGVKYVDIRMEMVDHIATALEEMEGNFYDDFKNYMVVHKSQFLNSSRKFNNAAIGTSLRAIGKEMLGPWFLVPLSLMLGTLYFSGPVTNDFVDWAEGAYGLCFVTFALYVIYVRGLKKIVFSAADKLMGTGILITYIANRIFTLRRIDNDYKLAGFIFFTAFTIAIISAFYKIVSKYKRYYA